MLSTSTDSFGSIKNSRLARFTDREPMDIYTYPIPKIGKATERMKPKEESSPLREVVACSDMARLT